MEERNRSRKFREELKKRRGTKCFICGDEHVEYHHLIPLWMGGEDTIDNMIALCHWHHMLMHKATSTRQTPYNGKASGRKRKTVDGYKDILNDYLKCRIGKEECKKALGVKGNLTDLIWFREYLEECGIADYRNNIDIYRSRVRRTGKKPSIPDGIVEWIQYKDGRKEEFGVDGMKEPLVRGIDIDLVHRKRPTENEKGQKICCICGKRAKWAQKIDPNKNDVDNWRYMCGVHSELYRVKMEKDGVDITRGFEMRL